MASENQPVDVPAVRARSGDTGLLMIGAAVVLGAWVVFDVIMGEFGYTATYYAVPALVLLSILGLGGLRFGDRTLKLLGWFMGLVGIFLLVDDLRYGFPEGAVANIANVVFYVGFLLMFLGARGLSD
jgi:hypothetical protein